MSLILAFLLKHWRWFALAAFLAAVAAASGYRGYQMGKASGEAEVRATELAAARAETKAAQESARLHAEQAKRYQTRSESMAATATQYQEALKDANRKHDRTVADLRSGNLRLSKLWQGCAARVPPAGEATPGQSGADGEADDRAASAGRIVRAAAECDAQVNGLQKTLIDERAP